MRASEKAPATWPNICDSNRLRATPATLTAAKGALPPERGGDGARDELLAHACLTLDEHVAGVARREAEDGLGDAAQAERPFEPGRRRRRLERSGERLAVDEERAADADHRAFVEGHQIARREAGAVHPGAIAGARVGDAQGPSGAIEAQVVLRHLGVGQTTLREPGPADDGARVGEREGEGPREGADQRGPSPPALRAPRALVLTGARQVVAHRIAEGATRGRGAEAVRAICR